MGGECPNQKRHTCFGDESLATKRIWANQICRPLFRWKLLKKLLFLYIDKPAGAHAVVPEGVGPWLGLKE